MNKQVKHLAIALPVALSLAACADDGFNNDEKWVTSVKNSQLDNPTEITYTKTTTSDTTKTIVFTWPVVHGAGGYLVTINNVFDPTAPFAVITDTLVDRCSFSYDLPSEQEYQFVIRTAANEKYNNKQAESTSVLAFDTYVPSVEIPNGSEISSWLAANLHDSDVEQGFTLAAGGSYTLDTLADFGTNIVEFRGNKNNRPTVTLGEKGGFATSGGLKLVHVNFDCTNATGQTGIINMGSNPSESLMKKYSSDANSSYYHDESPVQAQNCTFKAVPNAVFADGGATWCVKTFTIDNCIIELNPDDSKLGSTGYPFIDFTHTGITIKDITFSNSTIINLKKSSAYFIRFSNGSNASIQKAYGKSYTGSFVMDHCTLVRCTASGQFGNNCWTSGNATTISWNGVIFYDCCLLQKLVRNLPCTFTNADNTIWGVTKETDSTDQSKFATLEDPVFEAGDYTVDVIESLDLSKENGGLNLKPTNGIAAAQQYGDPRWFVE